MFRCDSYYFILLYATWIVYKLVNLFSYFISGETIFFDIIFRINLNDTLLNAFSFYWTSFFYLPLFFLSLFFANILYIQVRDIRLTLLFIPIFFFFFCLFEITNTITLEFNNKNFIFLNSFINELLINSLNKYHPFIFYSSSLFLFFICIIFINNIDSQKLFKTNTITFYEMHSVRITFSLNIFALFLGSWWALQESTWGGWWNWDASEVFGLLVCFSNLMRLHSLYTFNNQYLYYIKYWLWICFFFLSYIIVQLNFTLLSHNFGIENLPLFNSEFFVFIYISLFVSLPILLLFIYWRNMYSILNLSIGNYYLNRFNFWLLFIFYTFLVVIIICISYSPLFEDYIHADLIYLISLVPITWLILNLILITLLLVINKEFTNSLVVLLVSVWSINLPITILVLLILIKYCRIRISHILLIIIFVLNLKSSNTSYILVEYLPLLSNIVEDYIILQPTQVSYSCDSFFIQRVISYNNTSVSFNSFSNLYHSSLYNPNNYILFSDANTFTNFYFRRYNLDIKYYNIKNVMLTNLIDFILLLSLIILLCIRYLPFIKNYY